MTLDHAQPSRKLGPFRIERELGDGGMGRVYLAHDETEDREVALKVMRPDLVERQGFFKRFEREASAGERVDHPNVVRTLESGFQIVGEETLCYLVMEYVEGRTLRELLRELGHVPEALVREIARQAAAGLVAIHAAGIVHRDLKPENVLITKDHRVRIMDLGVAKAIDATQAITQEGQFAGTFVYAAPEQFGLRRSFGATGAIPRSGDVGAAKGGAIDPRADLYALGVVLHELASGSNPFARETAAEVMRAHLDETAPDLQDVLPDLSPFLAELVAHLLEKTPERRFESAATLLAVLEEGEESAWWAARDEERRRRRSGVPRVPVRRETSLHGRESDLALLADLWTKAKAGKGSTLLVEGEAGIGKSRLVDAFLATLATEPAHVLYGSYAPSGGAGGLSDAVLQRFGAARLDEALSPYLTVTPTLVPAFAATLRDEAPPQGAPSLQGDALHAVFVHLMRALAAERPLVWVVEDLHFATAEARKILLSLARAVEGHRVLLVLTSRPPVAEDEAALLARTGTFRRTQLARLSPREVIELLRDAFRSERLVEKLAPKIAEKSDGVPFFIFEMIRGLKEGQFITQSVDGSWIESKVIERIDVPSAVKDLIEVRLRDLTKEQRDLVDVGAVVGYEFEPELVAAVLERRPIAVMQDLAHVERRFGVVRATGRRHRFDHHQIQEVVYAGMPQALREGYHALVAETLEARAGAATKDPEDLDGAFCVEVAEHFLAGDHGERSLRYLDAALTHLEKGYRNGRAIALAERALAVPGLLVGGERVKTLLRLAGRFHLLARREPQRVTIEEALGVARQIGDRQLEAVAIGHLGVAFWSVGRNVEAQERHERHLLLAREIGDRRGEAHATGNLGNVFYSLGQLADAQEHQERQLALARQIEDRQIEAKATGNLGSVLSALGRYAEAREHHERYLALAREIGDRWGEANATGNLGLSSYSVGRFAEARMHGERQLALAREIGDRYGESNATLSLGNVSWSLGRFAEARELYERSLALAREIGERHGETNATANLGNVFLALGHYHEARERYQRYLALARETGNARAEAAATGSLGEVLHTLGRHAEAREHHERHLALARKIGDRSSEALATGNLGRASHCLGRCAEAREHLERHLALAREIGHRESEALAAGNLIAVLLSLGRTADVRDHSERLLALAREIGDRRGEAAALAALGATASESGDAALAERLVSDALEIVRSLGARGEDAEWLLSLGALRARQGRISDARADLEAALAIARELSLPRVELAACAHLALLPRGDVAAALAALAAQEARVEVEGAMDARFLLWRSTLDRAHLVEAKRLLDFLVEHAPPDCHESMLSNVRLHREIAAAWAQNGATGAL